MVKLLELNTIDEVEETLIEISKQIGEIGYKPRHFTISQKFRDIAWKIGRGSLKSEEKNKFIHGVQELLRSNEYLEKLVKIYERALNEIPISEKYYTISQAADELGVSQRTVRNYMNSNKLEHIKDATGRIRIPLSSIKKFIIG